MAKRTFRFTVSQMTLLAMLTAILIILGYLNIPMPMGLSITFNMIPVAIAAMAMGVPGGLIIGGVFGLISFLQCYNIFGTSALGVMLVNQYPGFGFALLMFIQRFGSRVLVGLMAALIYGRMKKSKAPMTVQGMVTGFSAAFFNTLFFMTLLVLFFGYTAPLSGGIAEKGAIMYVITSAGINSLVEMAVAALVTSAVGVALKRARLIK